MNEPTRVAILPTIFRWIGARSAFLTSALALALAWPSVALGGFPDDGDWLPILIDGVSATDVTGDVVNPPDDVGDKDNPAAYIASFEESDTGQIDQAGDGIIDACDPFLELFDEAVIEEIRVHGSGGADCENSIAGGETPATSGWWLMMLFLLTGRRTRRRWFWALLTVLFMVPGLASANQHRKLDRTLNSQQFAPGVAGETDFIQVDGGRLLKPLRPAMGLFLNYADTPMRVADRGGKTFKLLESQLQADLTMALGITDRFQIGVGLPLTLSQTTESDALFPPDANDPAGPGGLEGSVFGDLRVVPKVALIQDDGGIHISLAGNFTLPTGEGKELQGSEVVTIEPELIVQADLTERFRIAANAGYLLRESRGYLGLVVGNEATFGLAAAYDLTAWTWTAIAEAVGRVGAAPDGGVLGDNAPMEARLALRWRPVEDWALTVGGGPGLTSGYGAPNWRAFAGLTYTAGALPDSDGDGLADPRDQCPNAAEDLDGIDDWDGCPDLDDDEDGVLDTVDRCPHRKEDIDGFEDHDGCPDPDNDADGRPDNEDKCPNEPEDADGFDDFDGCPDPDDDNDGVLDVNDQCRTQQEDKDGFEDEDGCPDYDNDQDGVPDVADQCPLKPEDLDGFQDADGCPDYDNDGDGFADVSDRCPLDPEDINGVDDEDGCPDAMGQPSPPPAPVVREPEPPPVEPTPPPAPAPPPPPATPPGRVPTARVTPTHIRCAGRIKFDNNSAVIRSESYPVIDCVVVALQDNPRITMVRVAGHTDVSGPETYNAWLSGRRAMAVRKYILSKGIRNGRVFFKGYGESQQIGPNFTADQRARNRRVEFMILEVNNRPVLRETPPTP